MTTKQVEEAFTLMGTNRIKCDKYFCGRGIINSFKLAKQAGNLDANGRVTYLRPRKIISKGLSAGASNTKIADRAATDEAAEATAEALTAGANGGSLTR